MQYKKAYESENFFGLLVRRDLYDVFVENKPEGRLLERFFFLYVLWDIVIMR